jgi:hypothetical protein
MRLLCLLGRHKWTHHVVHPPERHCEHCGVLEFRDGLGWVRAKKGVRYNEQA